MTMADFGALWRWWLVISVIGVVAWPAGRWLFQRLPDKGYAFSKMLGLLLASYSFWLPGSLGFVHNSLGGALLGLGLAAGLSLWAQGRVTPGPWQWIRRNWRYVAMVEIVFLALLVGWAWARAHHPAIANTEKPMEFAFLNSALRTPTFPLLDPWLSGFGISYYHFGYIMTAFIARLAGVDAPVAFNLAVAWLAAGTGIGALGLVYNLIAAAGPTARRAAWTLGVIAAVALPLAGNLQIVLEIAHANGLGSESWWRWLDIRDINSPAGEGGFFTSEVGPRFWWWWRSSRVIHEYHLDGQPEEGLAPIAEFPGFSFVLGDLHPHVLALPFAFLSLGLALSWYMDPGAPAGRRLGRAWYRDQGARLFLSALIIGGLSFLNTWDVLIHLFILSAAWLMGRQRDVGRWDGASWRQAGELALALAGAGILLYLPFYIGFRSQAGPPFLLPMIMRPTRLAHFSVIFGAQLVVIVTLVGVLAWQRGVRWRTAAGVALGLWLGLTLLMLLLGVIIAADPTGTQLVMELADRLGVAMSPQPASETLGAQVGWAVGAVGRLTPALLAARLTTPALTLFLALLIGAAVAALERETTSPAARGSDLTPFLLVLIITGGLLTLGPEFVYLKDNFGQRLNTIFKFYYQTWVVWGAAALAGLYYLTQRGRLAAALAGGLYVFLLAGALLFPIYGARSRAAEYGRTPTLDGLAQLQASASDEYAAIQWLRQEVEGQPVILEAVGGSYSPYGRVAAATGLPTVLGWPGHEYQWRGDTTEPAEREEAVRTIYSQPSWEGVAELLNQYQVRYIYVGELERSAYGDRGLDKFEALETAYRNAEVVIYIWAEQEG